MGGGGGGGALHWCRVMRGVCQKGQWEGQWEGQFMQHTLGGCHRGGPFRMGACAEHKRTSDTTMTTSAGDTLHYRTQAHTTNAIHPTPQPYHWNPGRKSWHGLWDSTHNGRGKTHRWDCANSRIITSQESLLMCLIHCIQQGDP